MSHEKTSNFGFELVDFNKRPWHEDEHNNWVLADALIARYLSITNVQGIWKVAIAVTVGQRYVDADLGTIWEVIVAHTTPSSGTFAAARAATNGQWRAISSTFASRGAWAAATAYSINDIVTDSNRVGIVIAAHTSITSYNTGVTAGNITTLIDLSSQLTAAAASAAAAAASAATIALPLAVASGGTGAITAALALAALGGIDGTALNATNLTSGLVPAARLDAAALVLANLRASNLSDVGNAATAFSNIKQAASDTATGVVEIATAAEVATGTDTTRSITPSTLDGLVTGKTDTVIAATDEIIFADVTDANKSKKDTVQGILDLVPAAGFTVSAEQATTSGTTADLTGIPAGTKVIIINLEGVSTDSDTGYILQLGDAGGIEASGYASAASALTTGVGTANLTTGFLLNGLESGFGAAVLTSGSIVLTLKDAANFTWVAHGVIGSEATAVTAVCAGRKSLSAELTQVRLTFQTATAFDAGSINATYIG